MGRGTYRIRVNDRRKVSTLQMVDGSGSARAYHDVFAHLLKGVVDELAVWQRALPDEELEQLYQAGADGRALAQVPPPAVAPSDEK